MTLGLRQRIAFAAPMAPMAALHAPMLATMPAIYAKYAPIGLAQIAVGMFALRLLDVVLDPLIGHLSDRTPIRYGRRKGWVAAGLLGAIPTTYFWLRPGEDTGLPYFLGWTAAAACCWALVEIAHGAWVGELSDDYDGRVALSFWRTEALYVGSIAFAAIPLLPFLGSTALTPPALAAGSWGIMAGLVLALVALLAWAPVGSARPFPPKRPFPPRPSRRAMWRALTASGPLRLLIGQQASAGLASGMVAALYFFFVDAWLGLLDRLAYVALGTYAVALAAAPLWPPVIRRAGRSRTQVASFAATAVTVAAMALIPRHGAGFVELAALFALSSALSVGREGNIVTMIADAADEDELRGGDNRAGLFFAACTIAHKAGVALGGAAALLIAGGFGFDPKGDNGAGALRSFFLAFTVLPCVFYAAAAVLAACFPIDRHAHDAMRERLGRA